MNKVLRKDISIKAVSIFMAVLFWFYVLNVDNPYVLRRIPIQLKVENENALQEKGLVLKSKYNTTIEITVRGREEIINSLNASDFIAVLDFSKVKSADDKTIRIDGPYHNIRDITIPVVSPRFINIELEKIKKNSFPVEIKLEGSLKENYKILNMKVTPENVTFEDVESLIKTIGSVKAVVDINGLDRDLDRKIECKVYNKEGKEITALSKDLTVNLKLEVAKEVPITLVVNGNPARDHVEVLRAINPQRALIKGPPEILDRIYELKTEPVNIDNITQSINTAGKIKLPEGVILVNTPKEVAVNVEVEKLVNKEFTVAKSDINVFNTGLMGYEIMTENVVVTVKGKKVDVESLSLSSLKPSIDIGELKEGTHRVSLNIYVPTTCELVGEYDVEVKITKPQE